MGVGRGHGWEEQKGCLSAFHYYGGSWLSGKWEEMLRGLSQTA